MFAVIFSLIACSQTPVVNFEAMTHPPTPVLTFTPWVAGTETALANNLYPTPLDATLAPLPTFDFSTPTSSSPRVAPTYTPAQTTLEKPTDFSPVLYGGKQYDTTFFLLLGGVSRDAWLAPDESVARFNGEVTYSLNNMEYEAKYFLWGKVPQFSPTCKIYTIGTDAVLDEAGFVGVVDGWAVTKRFATELSADGQFYQQAVLDWLKTQGVDAPEIGSLHVFRVDIEGDGTDEIFISATHLDGSQHTTKAGDYSVILMRKVIGNETVTIPLVADVYSSKELEITFPREYSLENFIDLNQDGVLEVVVSFLKWEGFGASVFQVNGQDVIQTLSAGC